MQFYINRNQQQLGPFDEAEVRAQLANGTISPHDLVWWEGQTGWVQVGQSFLAMKPATGALPAARPAASASSAVTPVVGEKTSSLAIAALASGIAGLFIGFTFIAAIILGHMSLSEIRKNPGMKGRGMAIAGLILGYMLPAFALIAVVAFSVLIALGSQVKSTFQTINAQLAAAQSNTAPASTTNAAPANGQ
jgi:hypothetical protein